MMSTSLVVARRTALTGTTKNGTTTGKIKFVSSCVGGTGGTHRSSIMMYQKYGTSSSSRAASSRIIHTMTKHNNNMRMKMNRNMHSINNNHHRTTTITRAAAARAAFSSSSSGGGNNKESSTSTSSENKASSAGELVLTPGEKVVVASRLTMWGGIMVFAGFCGYYILTELFPTRMGPNSVFDAAFKMVKNDPEIKKRYGESLKAYGRDHGGHREGRRNFVENTQYTEEQDGSKRTRVRFNMEGQFGDAYVFAEISSAMPSGEFVYLMVQDKANGRVQMLADNRSAITAARLAGDNKEGAAAMSQLLGGGRK